MSLLDYFGGSQIASTVREGSSAVYNSISNVQNYVNGVASAYVLSPYGMEGIAGFIFDYEGDDQMVLEADITDHYAEDNSAVQDHIALKPYRITLRGFVSELSLPATGSGKFGALSTLQSTMQAVPAYLGKYTPQALQTLVKSASGAVSSVQNYANEAAQYLNQAKNIAALFGGNTGAQTRQQQAYVALASLRDEQQIFNVLTPWGLKLGMAIESLMFIQPKESKTRSDIIVTMKQMRFVEVEGNSPFNMANFSKRAASQYASQVINGATSGTPVSALGNALDPLSLPPLLTI